MKAQGFDKPIVASLAGDAQVEEQAAEWPFAQRTPASPHPTEIPVAALGTNYRWARGAGSI